MPPFILALIALMISFNAQASPPALQSGIRCNIDQIKDIQSYYVSEKYDGVRAYWDGQQLLSRKGNNFHAPSWFTNALPAFPLDGELWIKRLAFDEVSAAVRNHSVKNWQGIHYLIFDAPQQPGSFQQRLYFLLEWKKHTQAPFIEVIKQTKVNDKQALFDYFHKLTQAGAEGLMLHHQSAFYRIGRNPLLCKFKPYQDTEAMVIAYSPGKGAFENMLGALIVKDPQGKTFKIGSGFTIKERQNPPKIGDLITFRYNGFTKNNKPRFARFLRIRENH